MARLRRVKTAPVPPPRTVKVGRNFYTIKNDEQQPPQEVVVGPQEIPSITLEQVDDPAKKVARWSIGLMGVGAIGSALGFGWWVHPGAGVAIMFLLVYVAGVLVGLD